MALLWCDGYEGYGNSQGTPSPTGVVADKYAAVDQENQFTTLPTSGRSSGAAMQLSSTSYPFQTKTGNITSNSTLICGVALYVPQQPDWQRSTYWPLFRFETGDGTYAGSLTVTGASLWWRDSVAVYTGGSRVTLTAREYNYIEIKVFTHASAGTVEVKVNGCTVMQLSGLNTAPSGLITKVGIGGTSDVQHMSQGRIDDFYVCDGSGSTNNDFLGDVTVRTLYPDGDDTIQFATTGNGSYSTHYEQVNYANSLPSTDYVEDGSTGNRDIYTLDNSTDNFATVFGVMGWTYARYETSANTYRLVCDSNGTESESSNVVASSVYRYDSFILENNPDTASAWTDSTINAMKFGFEVQ